MIIAISLILISSLHANHHHHKNFVIKTHEDTPKITIEEDLPVITKTTLEITHKTGFFIIENRKLEKIEPGAFFGQNIHEGISLRENKLTNLAPNTFTKLKIRELLLGNNLIEDIEREAITDLPRLWKIDLSHNRIQHLHWNSITNTASMKFIDLTGNNLQKLDENCFFCMGKHVKSVVKVGFNNIEEIHPKVFESIDVEYLNLQDNKIRRVPGRIFNGNSIERMYLQNNLIEGFSDGFYQQKDLKELDLSGNPLRCREVRRLKRFAGNVRAKMMISSGKCS